METFTVNTNKYVAAQIYAKKHNVSIEQLVDNFLNSFSQSKQKADVQQAEMPAPILQLRGILKDAEKVEGDERLNYLLNKHK